MNDQHKSKEQLIEELSELRQQIQHLKTSRVPVAPKSQSTLQQRSQSRISLENSSSLIVRFNQSMEVLFANPIAIKVLGIGLTNYVGKTPTQLNLTGNYHKLWNIHLRKTFITKQPTIFEAEFINHRDEHFYYRARLVPEFASDGCVKSVLCTVRNMSQLKKAIFALRTSEKRNNRLLAALPDLLIYLSNDGVYLDTRYTSDS